MPRWPRSTSCSPHDALLGPDGHRAQPPPRRAGRLGRRAPGGAAGRGARARLSVRSGFRAGQRQCRARRARPPRPLRRSPGRSRAPSPRATKTSGRAPSTTAAAGHASSHAITMPPPDGSPARAHGEHADRHAAPAPRGQRGAQDDGRDDRDGRHGDGAAAGRAARRPRPGRGRRGPRPRRARRSARRRGRAGSGRRDGAAARARRSAGRSPGAAARAACSPPRRLPRAARTSAAGRSAAAIATAAAPAASAAHPSVRCGARSADVASRHGIGQLGLARRAQVVAGARCGPARRRWRSDRRAVRASRAQADAIGAAARLGAHRVALGRAGLEAAGGGGDGERRPRPRSSASASSDAAVPSPATGCSAQPHGPDHSTTRLPGRAALATTTSAGAERQRRRAGRGRWPAPSAPSTARARRPPRRARPRRATPATSPAARRRVDAAALAGRARRARPPATTAAAPRRRAQAAGERTHRQARGAPAARRAGRATSGAAKTTGPCHVPQRATRDEADERDRRPPLAAPWSGVSPSRGPSSRCCRAARRGCPS